MTTTKTRTDKEWKIEEVDTNMACEIRAGDCMVAMIPWHIDAYKLLEAYPGKCLHLSDDPAAEKLANLIVNAPKLLEACKVALVRLEDYANLIPDSSENQTITGGHENLIDGITSAIAKAEGRV